MANHTVQSQFPDNGGPTRLEFTSDPSSHAVLDGAWWPRTRSSASELAGLIAALDAKNAVVGLIMLNPYGWLGRPRRVHVADRTVRIAWIADLDPMVVIGTATQNRRIDLLIMMPAVEDDTDLRAASAGSATAQTSLRRSIVVTTRALAEVENESPSVWIEGVRAALLILRASFHEHNDIATTTPRLSYAAAQLNRERGDIGVLLDRALAQMAQPASAIPADRIRAQISSMLQQLTRYQQRGSDLIHEADQVDIGGQG